MVGGDFNVNDHGLDLFDLWRRLGWLPAQAFAEQFWNQPRTMTCKHATEKDLIWLSPEAQALCKQVEIADVFADHSTIAVGLWIPCAVPRLLVWNRPSKIPWEHVDSSWTSAATPPSWNSTSTSNEQWAEWASSFESSLDGFLPHQPATSLTSHQRGRLQQHSPQVQSLNRVAVKPSRPSEVQLRNDLIGTSVKLWFRQLRRLQSYLAAIQANKQTANAVSYRLELWSCILRSPGFGTNFQTWWVQDRQHHYFDHSVDLPSAPPSASLALEVFLTFKLCFERFESWHLRQRGALLRAKYESGMKGIFQDLRPVPRERLDLLCTTATYEILDVSVDTKQLHLDLPVPLDGFLHWTSDSGAVCSQVISEKVIQVSNVENLAIGDQLVMKQICSDTSDLHRMLCDFWRPVWQAMPVVDADVWRRVSAFFRRYVPRLSLEVDPISPSEWKKALRRYKPTAARGVDGLSHRDLLALPDAWTDRLLEMLHQIELGTLTWPDSVLFGIVNVLAKDVGACTVDRYRPIVIYSVLYRTWASIRAKQLLRKLAPHMDVEAYGFMPGCETSQVWLLLQSDIEGALQTGEGLCGLSTDLIKAFNFVPRQHTFELARHLGVSTRVLLPREAFLTSCTRSFEVRGALSEPLRSSCGLPEGDALSVYAMTQLCFAWHLYQRAYSPDVRSLSFVDNLGLVAATVAQLVQSLACLITFFQMWNLQLDADKSYCWALTTNIRRQLSAIPFRQVEHAHELGGVLSFTRRPYTGLQQKRLERLPPLWKRLQSSFAPLRQKLAVIPIVFWNSALYGVNGSCLGECHVTKLRTQALKALRLAQAGVNGALRLTLSSKAEADPGFWRLKMTFTSFVRLLRKEPRLMGAWQSFMAHFDGSFFSGPFSQLLIIFGQIGWHIDPPYLVDHDGCQFHVLNTPVKVFHALLFDAWLQHLAHTVQHRKTMADLIGLDAALAPVCEMRLDALQASLVGALQSGAFLGDAIHSKYDKTKSALCNRCQVPDTVLHWLECPRFAAIRQGIENWQDGHHLDTTAMKAHLLPSRSPFWKPWKNALLTLDDQTSNFLSFPGEGVQHIFTDGTATQGKHPYNIAAWGVLNASTGQLINLGHVTGLCQTNDRAELAAVVDAVRWQCHYSISMHLWVDSKTVVDGILFLLQHGVAGAWSDLDLWECLADLLQQLGSNDLTVHWIPSHLDLTRLEDAFEDWVQLWNDRIDAAVGDFNFRRSLEFLQLREAAIQHHTSCAARLQQLREFYFGVAAMPPSERNDPPESPEVSLFGFVDEAHSTLVDLYMEPPEYWVADSPDRPFNLPAQFIVDVYNHLLCSTSPDFGVYPLCCEELTIWLARTSDIHFPFIHPRTGAMDAQTIGTRYERPTFVYLFKHVRSVLRWLVDHIEEGDSVWFDDYSKVDLGVHRPVEGIFIRLPEQLVQKCQSPLCEFTRTRPLRKVCDMARPC